MQRIVKLEIIFTIAQIVFFGGAGLSIERIHTGDYGTVSFSFIMFIALAIGISAIKFWVIRKRLGKMSEKLMPVKSSKYKTKIIVHAIQAMVSLETSVISSYALVMFLIAFASGLNTPQFHSTLNLEHMATLGIFPALDLFYLISSERKSKD